MPTSDGQDSETDAASTSDPVPTSDPAQTSDPAPTSGGEDSTSAAPGTSDGETSAPSTPTDCTIEVTATLSESIGTVGIVTFTTDLGAVEGGYIEFGPDTNYGTKAPLDLAAEGYRTLLLGMTASTEYHFRVVAEAGGSSCQGADQVLTTGATPAEVPQPTVESKDAAAVTPGFIITSAQAVGGDGGYYMAIYNHLGQAVWWHKSAIGGLVTRTKLSWDGKYMYGRDGNPSARSGGQVVRVAMDGSKEDQLEVDTGHHDLAVTPDNGVLFLVGGGGDSCSRVAKWSADDELSDFYDLRDAFGDAFKSGNDPCHCNSIHYNPADTSISISCLMQNAYLKLSDKAELLWVLGGNNGQSQITGDINWDRQHGHHMFAPDHLLFFNNNGGGDSESQASLAVELELDVENKTATRVWEYEGGPGSQTLGDVERLPGGNTLVTYCNDGVLHEVNADKQAVQTWTFRNGVGYADHRASLYGAPPRP